MELSEEGKLKLAKDLKEHVELAQEEHAFYNKVIEDARTDPHNFSHITFDFSEAFAILYHSRQPGPVYVKVLYRVNDFGIANELKGEQIHHIFTESQTIGKDNGKNHGPNCVVSMIPPTCPMSYSLLGCQPSARTTRRRMSCPFVVLRIRRSSRLACKTYCKLVLNHCVYNSLRIAVTISLAALVQCLDNSNLMMTIPLSCEY